MQTLSHRPDAPARPAAAAPRVDLYQPIHKALRSFMGDTLVRLGALDTTDAGEVEATLGQAEALLALMASHAHHENDFLHPAIESRRPGATSRAAGEHVEHLASVDALQAEVATLRRHPGAERALRLYRHFALFMAENLAHMHHEETVLGAALWDSHCDAELEAIHRTLLASVPPQEMALVLRWMVPALDPAARVGLLAGMQSGMPPENFRAVLDIVRPRLDDSAWAKLARALGLPPVPGLMTV
jgi:hypothetical protein